MPSNTSRFKLGGVKERYERYKFDDVFANVATTTVDPRLSSLYNKVSDLVGIDKSIDELVKMLSEGGDVSKKKLKIVSVVGIGGLGKTTLAKAVYEGRKNFFDCGAVVSVGRNPDVKKVLEDILYELDKKKYIHIIGSKMDEKKLIDEMREFLAEKRYLIVIDDVWNIETWEIIKCALMDSNPGSRIITTTRISEVAMKIGGVYSIKPLSDDNSKKLLFSRIFGDEGISPVDHYVEVSKKLLTKCGGVPLSIITIASLLAYKPRDEWPKVYDSIGFGYEDNEAVKNMRKILSFSYYDLPSCLKTCLLHLSTFPEDYLIKKNQLIWRWVAEGFIPNKQGAGSFELGEKYFNDLINRSMIRWIEPGIIVDQGGCRVHDMVLDLICTLSNELNFVTTQDTMQHNSCSPGTSKIGRRLAMHNARDIKHMDIGHVRSFYSNRFDIGDMPPLSSFKVLRVLSLEDCNFSGGGGGLEHLGKLVHLRYLGLLNTPVAELPSEIGHDLKFLQTLVVEGTGIKELPASVGELSKLMCLRASEGTRMVAQIGKLTAMEELQLYSADKCPNLITELGKLTEARVLSIYFDEMDESAHKVLVQSLGNLRKVQILEIEIEGRKWHHFGGWEDWAPPSQLHQLWLPSIIIPRWLSWMDSSRVPHLSFLNLAVEVINEQDLRILGRMPLLRTLFICCENDLSYTVGSGEFQSLAELRTTIEIMCGERALPMLESLYCYASVGNDVGLAGNMPLLQFVAYQLDCKDRSAEEVEAMVAALRHTARTHPNCPMLRIKRSNNEFQPEYYYGDENDTSVQSKLTLDVRDSGIKELSPPVDGEDKLMRLRASKGTRLVSEIGKLTSLKELQLHHVDKSPNFATELGKLTEMNVLRIHFDQMDEWAHKILVKSLCNLHRLQNVEIWSEDESCAHLGVWEEWAPPTELDELSLYGIVFPRVPSWMNSSCVLDLSSLWLEVESVEMRDLQILGRLPSLHALYLRTGNHLLYSVGSDEFHKLRALFTDVKIMFEAEGGELPMLDVLECYASVGINVGLAGNMPLLKRVTYHLDCEGCNDEQVEAAEAALRHAAQVHPNRPTLEIERYGGSNVSQSGDDGVDKISLEEEAAAASQP